MKLIWATRGHSWGFRFLRDGGISDPLLTYEEAFAGTENSGEAYRRSGGAVALRFSDPEDRRDAAGRVIPHSFVIFGPESEGIDSVDSGRALVWPLVRDEYKRIWNEQKPTASA
ncbi:hypothetical protein F7P69_14785 [Cellulosimicrobium funkei]|nr:hypothetical protein [Cellulosimicrobium funkei]